MILLFLFSFLSVSQPTTRYSRKLIQERNRNRFSRNNQVSISSNLDNINKQDLIQKAVQLFSNSKSLDVLKTIFLLNDDDCTLCHFAMPLVINYLKNERNVDGIVNQAEAICSYVDDTVRDICIQMVGDYVPIIVNYITQQLEANDICQVIGIC